MYCEWKTIDDILKCSYCSTKFTDVVKLIPECGQSICGQCYEAVSQELSQTGQFKCKECGEQHDMPKSGLVDNQTVLKMLQLKPKEKPLSDSALTLKSMIEEVYEKIESMKSQDGQEEINFYCDSLELEVTETLKSAVEHLNKLQDEFIKEINDYRNKLLSQRSRKMSVSSESLSDTQGSPTRQELAALSAEMDAFRQEWSNYFTQMSKMVTYEEIEQALGKLTDYESKSEKIRYKLNCELFNGRFVRFRENELFCTSNKHLGVLAYNFSSKDHTQAEDNRIEVTLKHTMTGHAGFVNQVIFLPNGDMASCSSDETIKIWNLEQTEMRFELSGPSCSILSLALLRDGSLVSGSWSGAINIWDLDKRISVRALEGHTGPVFSLKVLQNDNLASCSYDDTIKVWNPCADESPLLQTMTGHGINCFSNLFGLLSSGCLVTCFCTFTVAEVSVIKIWNPSKGKLVKSLATSSKHIRSMIVLANDNLAAGFCDGTIRLFGKLNNQKFPESHQGAVLSLLQLPNGYLVSGGSRMHPIIKVWDPASLRLIATINSQHEGDISSLAVSNDGKLLASGSEDKTIKIWSLTY